MCNIKFFVSLKLIQNFFHFHFFIRFIHFCHHDCLISYITDCFDCKHSKNLQYFKFKNECFYDNQQNSVHFLFNIILFMSIENNKFEFNFLILIIFCQKFKFFTVIKSHFFDFFVSLTFNVFLSFLEQSFDHFAAFILDEKYSFISHAVINNYQNILIFYYTFSTVRLSNIHMNLLQ